MTKEREALKLALEALKYAASMGYPSSMLKDMFAPFTLKEALAQPEQEPVVYIRKDQLQKAAQSAMLCEVTPEPRKDRIRIYTTPPQRPWGKPWVSLTDEEIESCANWRWMTTCRAIEAKLKAVNGFLKEKNT